MGLKNPKEIYDHAIKNDYALGAFNTFSLETALAVMDAAEEMRSPAIIQVSMGARKFVKNLDVYVEMLRRLADKYEVPFFIQHDHCPTVEACKEAIEAGCQSVMFDGSHLPYEDNVEQTKEIVEYAHKRNIWVEAELGCLPGFEDFVFAEKAVYTNPQKAKEFIALTGCDALAVAVGTSHGGVRGDDYLPLDLELMKKIAAEKPGYPFVLHGAASLPPELITACNEQGGKVEYLRNCSEESIAAAVKAGAKKVNMDVDNFLVYTTEVRKFLNEKPSIYDPRKYLKPAEEAFQREVMHKMLKVRGSSGQY